VKPAPFTYHAPKTRDEALGLLANLSDHDARILAGGQSLTPMMALRLASPEHLIDINSVDGFADLTVEGPEVRIGPTVRHATLEKLGRDNPVQGILSTVAPFIAHWPIRVRGTFCGSIVHADPASEWCLTAVTLNALVDVSSVRGQRAVAAEDFFLGIMTTDLQEDEMVTGVRMPALMAGTRFGFHEISRRAGDFAMAAALVTYRLESGRIVAPCVGLGGVEAKPRRIAAAEAVLTGAKPEEATFREAGAAAAGDIKPLIDDQIDAAYRRELAQHAVGSALRRSLT
jgi:carbon-monoxide dehydrogenase medium subunit